MAVVDAGLVPVRPQDIVSYLALRSEIKGNIEHPERYFDTTNINRNKQFDMLLMAQGWRDFVWRRLADSAIRISYKAEDGFDVTGKVKNEKNDNPLPGLNITLYASAVKGVKLLSAVTDAKGNFAFPNLLYYGELPVKLSAINQKGEKTGTFYMDTLSTLPVKPQTKINLIIAPVDTSTAVLGAVIKRQAATHQASLNGPKNLKEVKITASRAVITNNGIPFTSWGPDQAFDITPKDSQYKTLEWFVLQHVKGALQSNIDTITGVVIPCVDTFRYVIYAPGPMVLYRPMTKMLPPQFFINGVDYTTDNSTEAETYRTTYYPLSIDKFKRIVVKHVLGNLVNAANPQAVNIMVDRYFIYLTLKEDAMIGYNPGSLRPVVNGYYQTRSFYKPMYDTPKNLAKPDLRTTIHWEPNITTDAKGEATITFYNADPKTTVRVVVQGVATTGTPLASIVNYTIK